MKRPLRLAALGTSPFRGGKPLRRGRADEGIGPYRVQCKIEEAGGQWPPKGSPYERGAVAACRD